MKKLKLIFVLSICATLLGCAPSEPKALKQMSELEGNSSFGVNHIRGAAIHETAMSFGAKGGLAWRSQKINQTLKAETHYLNNVFNFRMLMLQQHVLPPVLEEGHNAINLADPKTLRLADRTYKILTPPRFVTNPPNWRDYLWMNYPTPDEPDDTLLPKNWDEQQLWNETIKVGWTKGVAQANRIFAANLARLHRDYQGMVIYRMLYAQHMVSAPYVANADLGVTGGGHSMRIGDRVLRITATSELQSNPKAWRAIIAKDRD